MTKYSTGKTNRISNGGRVGYSAGKSMAKTSTPSVKVSYSQGQSMSNVTNVKGDPKGCPPWGRGK